MSSSVAAPPFQPEFLAPAIPERLLTAADLAALPDELPSGPVLYELDNGRLVIMAPPGDLHGSVEAKFTALLFEAERRGHGKVRCGEVGVVLWKNPDRVVGVDTVFICTRSLPIRKSPEGYLLTIPELVVEVLSKNDTFGSMEKKVEDYLTVGVVEVWVASPATRTVRAYRKGREPVEYTESDSLIVEDLIPGFRLSVREVFAD